MLICSLGLFLGIVGALPKKAAQAHVCLAIVGICRVKSFILCHSLLILSPNSSHLAANLPLANLYLISLLNTLNARERLREKMDFSGQPSLRTISALEVRGSDSTSPMMPLERAHVIARSPIRRNFIGSQSHPAHFPWSIL
jgi:hypothetical protein